MSEFVAADKLSVATLNQKTVYVGAAVPGTTYDGMMWVCTSSDPPLVKVYDDTNGRWIEHHEVLYETVTSGGFPAATPVLDGTLCVAYDTEQSATTLYARSYGSWRNMGGSLTRVYPVGDTQKTAIILGGTLGLPWGTDIDGVSGVENILVSTNITPTNSGDYVVAFIGGAVMPSYYSGEKLRLYIGTTKVADMAMTLPRVRALTSGAVCSNTSTNVYATIYCFTSNALLHTGIGFGVVSVKT